MKAAQNLQYWQNRYLRYWKNLFLSSGGLIIILIIAWCAVFPKVRAATTLPKNIQWKTNEKFEGIGSPKALRGGVMKMDMDAYPMTFRLYGPNSNDKFAWHNRKYCSFNLVEMHPMTLDLVPGLATHWAIMPDQKTLYFKLRKEVKFTDGTPVTADHYIAAYQIFLNPHLNDPFVMKNIKDNIETVEKIDDYTLKIVGKFSSWNAMLEFQLPPLKPESYQLDENWVKRDNWKPPICVGPYVLDKFKEGKFVNFKRLDSWWGDSVKFYEKRYNFDNIELSIIREQKVAFEHFKKGQIGFHQSYSAREWATETQWDAVDKGWIVKRELFAKTVRGVYGLGMNIKETIFQNKNFRKALQHLMDFHKINSKLMYNAYERNNSFFEGSEYANPNLKNYEYNPKKAEEYLTLAGWTIRGGDGILMNDKGERCSFTLKFSDGSAISRLISVIAEDFKSAGVEMKMQVVDSAKHFKDSLEKNFQMSIISMAGSLFPSPQEYLHSTFAKPNTNNFFNYSNPEVDQLLEVYKKELDFKKRQKAMFRIDEIVKDEAFYLPFWGASSIRVLYWNNISLPDYYEPKYSMGVFHFFDIAWFDAEKDKVLQKAMKENTVIPNVNKNVEVDFYKIKKK